MKIKNIGFRIKLIVIVEIIAIIIYLTLSFFVWKEINQQVREITRNKLITIASTTAALINVKNHEKIQEEDDEDSKAYQEIHEFLKKIMAANPEADDIYTFRKTEKENVWAYVVGGYEAQDLDGDGEITADEEPVGIGEEFSPYDFPPEILESFDRPIAEKEINCDKWGCWLSGYAPIYDKSGTAVAVAAVDIKADNILAFEKKAKMIIFFVLIVIFIIYLFILYLVLNWLLRPVVAIVFGMEKFKSNLSSRIKITTRDEFGLIADAFNKMAGELEILYRNLEGKVKEKTKQLADRVRLIEQKNAENEALLRSLGEGVIAFDWNGRIIVINELAEKMLGKKKKDILGKVYTEVVKFTNEKGLEISLEENPITITLKKEEQKTYSNYHLLTSLGKFPIMITVSPVKIHKKMLGVIAVFRDITHEKEVDKAKSEFVSLASHQLLTPLSSISWYTEMLMDSSFKKDTVKKEKYLNKIYKANQRMVDLVNSLLNVSRIEMGTFSIERQKIDLKVITNSLLDEFQPQIKAKGVKIKKDFGSGIENFLGDAKLVRMIMQNLLSNAIKYSKEEKSENYVIVSIKRGPKGEYILRISDNGYGIPENQKNRIFTKMFRADNIKEKAVEGTGLGLYIVKSIIEAGGGSISFESQEDKGTTFQVVFPAEGMKQKKGVRKLS